MGSEDGAVKKNADEQAILAVVEDIYNSAVTDADLQTAPTVDSYEEFMDLPPEEIRPAINRILAEDGRYTALKYLWWRFEKRAENYDEWYFLLFVEALEHQLLKNVARDIPDKLKTLFDTYPKIAQAFGGNPRLDYAYHQYTLLRVAAFLHQYLIERLPIQRLIRSSPDFDSDDDRTGVSFAKTIGWAANEGVIDSRTARLLHFIREVRNNAAHNMWLDRNYRIEVLKVGSDCAENVLNKLLVEVAEDHLGDELTFEDRSCELEDQIRDLHWWYDDDVHCWKPDDSPDDRRL